MNWSKFDVFVNKEMLIWHLEKYADSKIISYHWAKFDYEAGRYRSIKDKNVKR